MLLVLQVTIIDTGVRGMIAVGLAPQLYQLDHQPGWLPHSVAFNADDGKYVKMTSFTQKFNMFFYVIVVIIAYVNIIMVNLIND